MDASYRRRAEAGWRGGAAMSRADPIPATVVFAEAPGADGTLIVGAEQGDITVHAEFAGHPGCTLVLTLDDALELAMWMIAHVVDQRRRRQAREPC
jgi:hypothetical protein